MRILLLGARGQVGYELAGALASFAEVTLSSRADASLQAERVRPLVEEAKPDVIVNACAYTDVDGAEREPEIAHAVNCRLVGALGEEARRRRAALVHISTDFVFDGEKGAPYVETDAPAPLAEYGRSKLAGERLLLEMDAPAVIFRTAWVYSLRRKSFVTTMLRLARERETLSVVTDQIGSPTFCRDLAQAIALIVYGSRANVVEALGAARGVYHLAGDGMVSRYDWTRAILELDPRASEHRIRELFRIEAAQFPLPARRPRATPLDASKAFARWGVRLPPWRDALARALNSDVPTKV
ncbi:MAG TPA: dTDP-4-dehydrorhamnose reductase [Polyangiaceae bacterium]|jgi:dTDP-4-dehydrorhamnose reductase|nr:dTDP-4-dehydrorhamnose reductase [Polyangiaceae bacterium]